MASALDDPVADQGLTNLRWAYALVDGLAAAGVRRVVISPGARSTPLVLACARHPQIQTTVHVDERGAAFIALGQAKASGIPSAVIATSGSAPSHWYPALLEAALSETPLLLLSADRPPELVDWGVNQTLDQQRLFGGHARAFYQAGLPAATPAALRQIRLLAIKAVEQSEWPRPGPVHLNLPFGEPLIPEAPEHDWPSYIGAAFPFHRAQLSPASAAVTALATRLNSGPGLIVCGRGPDPQRLGPVITALAAQLGAPIIADPLSGLRWGPWSKTHLLSHYDAFLRDTHALPIPTWILRLGAVPVSKVVNHYLEGLDTAQFLIMDNSDWPDPAQRCTELLRADPTLACQALMQLLTPRAADWAAAFFVAEVTAIPDLTPARMRDEPCEGLVIQDLCTHLPVATLLFSSNSLPIRQLDTWSGTRTAPLHLICNRGTSGIDGNVSTLFGIASVTSAPVVGLLGDLALLHDITGLFAANTINAVILVFNNGGGGIFTQLPQAQLPGFERYWLTPHRLDLEQLASLFHCGYQRLTRQSALPQLLNTALTAGGTHIIDIPIHRAISLMQHQAYWKTGTLP